MNSAKREPPSTPLSCEQSSPMRSRIKGTSQVLANNTHNTVHNSQSREDNNLRITVSNTTICSENTLETNQSLVSNLIQNATLASDDTVELLKLGSKIKENTPVLHFFTITNLENNPDNNAKFQ